MNVSIYAAQLFLFWFLSVFFSLFCSVYDHAYSNFVVVLLYFFKERERTREHKCIGLLLVCF